MKDRKLPWSLGLALIWSGAAFAADATAPAYQTTQSSAQPAAPQAAITAASAPTATPAPPPGSSSKRSAADLEKLVAPIALYPDPLLATVLPASVYPLEIVQAARFVADTNNLAKLDEQPWDDNVKAVARVPEAIKKLNDDLSWTMELGEAFLAQDKDVMDAIQSMRSKAQKAGTLQTTPQQTVTVTNVVGEKTVGQQVVVVTNTVVQITPADSTVVYVPSYPYTVYYPPPGYVYNPYAPLVTFGVGIAVGAIIANNCDWWHGGCYHSDVDINIDRGVNRNVDRNRNVNNTRASQTSGRKKWQPDQGRLSKSGAPSAANTARGTEARGWSGAGTQPSARPSTGSGAARPAQPTQNFSSPTTGARPTTGSGVTQPSVRQPSVQQPTVRQPSVSRSPANVQSANRPAQTPNVSRPAAQPDNNAFSGVNSGARANNYSNRGAASRGGGGGAARGGGGGRR